MTIAPLLEVHGDGAGGSQRPRPGCPPELRVVERGGRVVAPCSPAARRPEVVVRPARGVQVPRRARRRRVLVGAGLAGLLVGLALPVSILGGAPAPAPRGAQGAALAGSTLYVVQPGDTLWSIASRFDRGGDPRPLAEAIARETGSAAVVPGEHIVLP